MSNEESIKMMIRRLSEESSFNELEKYFLNKTEGDYLLEPIELDNFQSVNNFSLKKYILKSLNRDARFKEIDLKNDSRLFIDLMSIIKEYLGNDYLIITFYEIGDLYRRETKNESFNIMFKKAFIKGKSGHFKITKTDNCFKTQTIGDITNFQDGNCTIGIDTTYKNNLIYSGHSFKGENILFYGYNIEENLYLMKLFETISPKKILNIIPIGETQSYFDNVD